MKTPNKTETIETKANYFSSKNNPLKSKIFNSSFKLSKLRVILKSIIATESFNRPSPKIIECTFGNFFFLIQLNTETVSVAVNVAERSNKFVLERSSILNNS